jgi:hypothetical protein
LSGWAVTLVWASLLGAGPAAVHAQPAVTTLYIDTASGSVGETVTTQVLAFVAQGETLSSFEFELAFDPFQVEPAGMLVADGWRSEKLEEVHGQSVRIGGKRDSSSCMGGSTCLLATLSWRVLQAGDSALVATSATLLNDLDAPLELQTSQGSISVTSGEPLGKTQGEGGSLGVGNALIGIAIMLLAGTAMAAPIVVWRARGLRYGATGEAVVPVETVSPGAMASAVAAYLATYESAGRIDTPVDPFYEQIARQTVVQAPRQPTAILRGSGSSILRDQRQEAAKE